MSAQDKKDLAKIHILKKELALDDDTYRAILHRHTGETSAAKLSHAQRLRVISYLLAQKQGDQDRFALFNAIATLGHAQGWHRNYAETIADSMFKRGLMQCTTPELGMVLESMQLQAGRNRVGAALAA